MELHSVLSVESDLIVAVVQSTKHTYTSYTSHVSIMNVEPDIPCLEHHGEYRHQL
jgi:hypothetical protein